MIKTIAAVVLALALVGCGNPADDPGSGRGGFKIDVVNVDGRQVTCITWHGGYPGGMSCDWR